MDVSAMLQKEVGDRKTNTRIISIYSNETLALETIAQGACGGDKTIRNASLVAGGRRKTSEDRRNYQEKTNRRTRTE